MVTVSASSAQVAAKSYLANNTVLIVRHAEKPKLGTGLTEVGARRAAAYVRYFEPLREDGLSLKVSALYAGADSESSNRPRLTLGPLAAATGMKLNSAVSSKEPEELVRLLRTEPHGLAPLICWRHGQIPGLLKALGASPETLLPGGKWPDDTYDWLVVLRFDAAGKLSSQKLVPEKLNF
jgi:hypothetical protein